ncbi:Ger(x)C family spore germination protein [[Clostridium] colinum]|uniref:Ger(x)C family spore germination protein n=1 Tax=[Clostridium] colinum TaxID=36835 RepID=UPI0020259AEF|nr:Ger(x)C family spore germination protein [[Clostridium] colinum]
MKIFKTIFILLFCSVFLTGCFDKVELEERAIVLAIGIDKYNEESDTSIEKTGEEKRFIVSLAMPEVPEGEKTGNTEKQADPMSKDKQENSINEAVKIAEGSSVASTMELIDTYMSKNLYYGHTKVVVLGKGILEDDVLLKEVIDSLERNNEISRKIIVLGTQGNAKEILQTIPKDEKMLGIYINDFYKNNKKNSFFTYRVDLEDIIQQLLSTGDTVIPNIQVIDKDVRLSGLIALKDSRYIGYLEDATTKGILWLIDKNSLGEISIPFEKAYVSTSIFKKKVEKKFYEENNKITCQFLVNLEGNISEYYLGKNIMIDTEKYKMIEDEISIYVKKEIENAINNIKSLNIDIIGLKELIRKNEYNLYDKYNLENNNIYDYVQFDIKCNTKIKGSGSIK